MPYIGNPIYQAAFVTDQFSGTGSQTAYTMSVAPAGTTNVLVAVSGVLQDPSTYGVSGNTLTFSAAPPSGTGNISCRYLGVPATGVVTTAYRTVTEFTATASQTTFTPPSYTPNFINVYRNGVLLGSADYTATNGTTVVLATGATAGDLVTVESFSISSVANAIANAAGSVSSSNIATGAVTPAKLSTGGLYWDTSSNVGIGTTSPTQKLDVNGNTAITGTGYLSLQRPIVPVLNQGTPQINFAFYTTGTTYTAGAIITASADGSWSSSSAPTKLQFYTAPSGSTSSLERLRLDANGYMTTPYQPTFCAVRNGSAGNQSVGSSSGSPTIFTWDTTLVNIGSCFNTANGRFTAPVAGTYLFVATVSWYLPSGNERWASINFLKNGSNIGDNYCGMCNLPATNGFGASTYANSSGNITLTLAAGDYIQVGAFSATAIALVWGEGCWLSGRLLG